MIVGGQTRACFNHHRLSSTIMHRLIAGLQSIFDKFGLNLNWHWGQKFKHFNNPYTYLRKLSPCIRLMFKIQYTLWKDIFSRIQCDIPSMLHYGVTAFDQYHKTYFKIYARTMLVSAICCSWHFQWYMDRSKIPQMLQFIKVAILSLTF